MHARRAQYAPRKKRRRSSAAEVAQSEQAKRGAPAATRPISTPTVRVETQCVAALERELASLSARKLGKRAEAAGVDETTLEAIDEMDVAMKRAKLMRLIVELEIPLNPS